MGNTASTERLGIHDRIVEAYELEPLVAGIQRVLDEKGVLTVADYQKELEAARNDGSRGEAG
jgi:hypothetical protein